MVEPESMVRIIDAFVDMLDLKQFGFNYFTLNKEGRPPYHPATLMKLYLYGYQNSVRTCRKLNVTTFISLKKSSSTKKNPDFAMESFKYDEKDDTYTCPADEIMHTNGKWYNKNLNNGRLIEKSEFQQYITRNNDRVNQNPDYYRQRQQIIEHQFGTLKRQWHFDYTLTKGKEKVLGEVYLIFTGYNLRRLMSIFDFKTLMSKIKAHFQQYIKHLRVKTSTQVLKKKQQTFYILLLRTILSLMEIRE